MNTVEMDLTEVEKYLTRCSASASSASLHSTMKEKGLDRVLNGTLLSELTSPNKTLEFINLEKPTIDSNSSTSIILGHTL